MWGNYLHFWVIMFIPVCPLLFWGLLWSSVSVKVGTWAKGHMVKLEGQPPPRWRTSDWKGNFSVPSREAQLVIPVLRYWSDEQTVILQCIVLTAYFQTIAKATRNEVSCVWVVQTAPQNSTTCVSGGGSGAWVRGRGWVFKGRDICKRKGFSSTQPQGR